MIEKRESSAGLMVCHAGIDRKRDLLMSFQARIQTQGQYELLLDCFLRIM
jgi:hypothetical protein